MSKKKDERPFWQKTKNAFEGVIPTDKMSEKLLSRPPVKFLLYVFRLVVEKTGFGKDLISDEILQLATGKGRLSKAQKIEFLTRWINFVGLCKRRPLPVFPHKISAGKDVDKTNILLGMFAQCAKNKNTLKWENAIKMINAGKNPDMTGTGYAKYLQDKKDKKKEEEKAKKKKESGSEEGSNNNNNNNGQEEEERKKREELEKKKREEMMMMKKKQNEERIRKQKAAQEMMARKKKEQEERRKLMEQKKREEEERRNQMKMEQMQLEEEERKRKLLKEKQEREAQLLQQQQNELLQAQHGKQGQNAGEQESYGEYDQPEFGQTSKPQAPRNAPPKRNSNLKEAQNHDGTTRGIIQDGESDDEDEGYVFKEASSVIRSKGKGEDGKLAKLLDEKGKKIITKKKEENEEKNTGPKRKKLIIKNSKGNTTRRNAKDQIKQLKENIQTVCRSTNPVGKAMDYVVEDLEAMNSELQHWKKQSKVNEDLLKKEKKITTKQTKDFQMQILDVEQNIMDTREKINNTKAEILRNEKKIAKILGNLY